MAEQNDSVADSRPEEIKVDGQLEKKENAYGDIPAIPVVDAVEGIKYDFNSGVRVFFPQGDKKYHLKFSDADTGLVMYDSDCNPGTVVTAVKKYYIRYKIVITEQGTGRAVFEHVMDLKGRKVVIQFPVMTIGDSVGWFSYIERFQKKHGCEIALVIPPFLQELVERQYPSFRFIRKEDTVAERPYASYYIGLFFKENRDMQPVDFRIVGLHRTAAYILGMRSKEELEDIPPRFDLSAPRQVKGKYVVISCKASAQCKFWNNPYGWDTVIRFLKDNGYRVLCIDKNRIYGSGTTFNQLPWGVEDYTGDAPLQERIDIIKDADFFIGLSSGLTWLAWGCKVPVVLISGFTLPNTEFYTPYRVINYQSCVGCWDDLRCEFDHHDYFWCPRHKDDEHRWECSRLIPPEQVINAIKSIPSFKPKK